MREYLDMNRYSEKVKQMAMAFYGLKFPSKTMCDANDSNALACIDGADRMRTQCGNLEPECSLPSCPLTFCLFFSCASYEEAEILASLPQGLQKKMRGESYMSTFQQSDRSICGSVGTREDG